MSDLNLAEDFPPVPTADWEAAIRADLKGADYEKRLVWHTEEGLAVRPYYRAEDIADLPAFPARASGHAWEIAAEIPEGPHVIRVDRLHEAGAHAAQELAWGMSPGVEMIEQGARDVQLVFAIGPYYFIEIAKFRAARLLWANVVAAFGIDATACPLRISAVTPLRNKSVYDRYNNLLRVTTEALSAVLGGCDSLVIEPFGFDPRLALNVQRTLRAEVHLDEAADPAAGSDYNESLTVALAREAWRLFQQIEAGDTLDRDVADTRAARESRRVAPPRAGGCQQLSKPHGQDARIRAARGRRIRAPGGAV